MDRARIEEFLDRFVGYASGATTIGLLAVADRVGLLADLANRGPISAASLAADANLDERYVREILSGLAAAGAIEYSAGSSTFSMPPEHGLFLVDDTSPYFMGGWFDMIPAAMSQIPRIAEAVAEGGGVGFEEFGPEMVQGIDRANSPSQRVFLTQRWLPAVPGLIEHLESGARVADVGCGTGTAAILMAAAYPNSSVTGFDVSEESLGVARSRGLGLSNLDFRLSPATELPVDLRFQLITTFDVIHDLADPLAGLRRIREALDESGWYLMMEPNASSNLEDNLTERGALLYGVSTMHCMTQSLAVGGEGLGAVWGSQMAERYASEAGFGTFTRIEEISNKFSAFYLLRP